MMKVPTAVIIALLVLSFLTWMTAEMVNEQRINSEERITYTGRVTAVSHYDYGTTIWLNSNAKTIRISNKNVQLSVGKEYQITIDGNYNLINAIILEGG